HIGSSCSVFKGLCRSRATTILVYHDLLLLSTPFLKIFYFFESFFEINKEKPVLQAFLLV
ncbi:hypothetical protein, partial [Streptococcus parasanguinis]|uniref:hypothetical protein n=1 Tax=Streptococcus parasanguinis TaxID=1318 RepID=UPI0034A3B6DE